MSVSGPIRILYMEDEIGLARLLQKSLQRKGHIVDIACNGEEGLAMLAEDSYDVLLVDHKMPVRGGLDVIRTLASRGTLPPTIMITGNGNEKVAVEAMKLGAADYIVKDVEMGYLKLLPTVIEQVLHKQQLVREKQQMFEAIQESEERFRALVENANDVIYTHDLEGNFTSANPAATRTYGYTTEEILQLNMAQIVDPEHLSLAQQKIQESLEGSPQTGPYELLTYSKEGEPIWVEVSTRLLKKEGQPVGVQGIAREITERKRAEEQIKASLQEKEVLLKEIHHRVKNNLQVLSSLLYLQSEYIEGQQSLDILKESQARVKSMSLVHERLYQSKDLTRIDFAEYVRNLAAYLFRSYGVNPDAITLKVNVDDVFLSVDTAIPCGLIINELVSNALKHAFPAGRAGEICISLRADDNELTLIVSNNGVGFPKDLDFRNTETLGLHLVLTLTRQLGGTIELDRRGGTTFKITFARPKR